MSIVVVSWNMNWLGRSGSSRRKAWEYLVDGLNADVALVQEAADPPSGWSIVGEPVIDETRRWGTLLVSPSHDLDPVTEVRRVGRDPRPWSFSQPGTAAAATTVIDGRALTLVSLYGAFDAEGWSYATVHRHQADLAPLLDSPEHLRQTIIAGDLNLTSQWSGKDAGYAPIDRSLLEHFQSWGLRDLVAESVPGPLEGCGCSDGLCRHVQTHWHRNSPRPWQDDYLFVSKGMSGQLALRVHEDAVTDHNLSDHAPLVLTIE
jgi:endonuclease/exonuclease/phosphatase family metal-dependent hydrolase